VSDERLDLFTRGLPDVLRATELGRILLDQRGIEAVLANQKAELVTEFGFTVAVGRLGRKLPDIRLGLIAGGQGSDLLDRANADPIRLAQGPVDRPGLGHAHFGAPDQGRDVGGVGIPIADKALAPRRPKDRRFEYPPVSVGVTELRDRMNANTSAAAAVSKSQQSWVGRIPAVPEVDEISQNNREAMLLNQLPERPKSRTRYVSLLLPRLSDVGSAIRSILHKDLQLSRG